MYNASLHDNQVDLSEENEVVYRDKGYFGIKAKGHADTMQRGGEVSYSAISVKLGSACIIMSNMFMHDIR